MKILDIPQSGRCGNFVSFSTPHGQSRKSYVVPRDPRTPEQLARRKAWAEAAPRWRALTELQRMGWRDLASQIRSHGRLGDTGFLLGHQLYQKINANRAAVGEPWVDEAPARPLISDDPVSDLSLTNTAGVIALGLVVTASPKHLILVSATAPVSAGRSRPRRFVFIGLLGHPDNGVCDLTQMYGAKYGTLAPNDRVFIQTVQYLDGWHSYPSQFTAVVPPA
jgi:hypothetical protein